MSDFSTYMSPRKNRKSREEVCKPEFLVYGYRESYRDDDYYTNCYWDGENFFETSYNCTFMDPHWEEESKAPKELKELFFRTYLVRRALAERAKLIEARKELNLDTYHEMRRLWRAFPVHEYTSAHYNEFLTYRKIERLLKVKNFRNPFRASLAAQVRNWLKEKNPTYRTPLSPRQMQFL